jgi:signal transduction histidine kinase
VAKPFVIEEFLAAVKIAVERRRGLEDQTADAITVFPDIAKHLGGDWAATDLLATVVHELRAPLTVIRGQAQLARRHIEDKPERAREAIDSALAQMDRMAHLISDLLNESRLSSNALTLSVVAFDLVESVAAAKARHEYSEPTRVLFERPRTIRVRGDPIRIAQILDNLLDNALKYSPAGSPVVISLGIHDGEAQVRVADQGVGVPADERGSLFTPFYRTSRTSDIPGTGLGLHISQQLAARHGGRLWLESSSDAGSVFAFALPLKR